MSQSNGIASGPFVRLLDVEPDLGADLAGHEYETAHRLAVAPVVDLPPGAVDIDALHEVPSRRGPLWAVMVADGLLVRDVVLAGRIATQLLGPGDVLDARQAPSEMLPAAQSLTASEGVRLALIDDRFLAATRRWPWMAARLLERAGRQVERGAVQQAISQLGRVDMRLLALMWHLAERFGRMTPTGIVVDLDLTHEALGRLAGAARPTVTLALKDLALQGTLVRRPGGSWVLDRNSSAALGMPGGPPAPATIGRLVIPAREEGERSSAVDLLALRLRMKRLAAVHRSNLDRTTELLSTSKGTLRRSATLRDELSRRRQEASPEASAA